MAMPSSVVTDENGMFVGVDGEYRVEERHWSAASPSIRTKTYTVASHNYMLKIGGDGFTMFQDDPIPQDEASCWTIRC